MEEKKVDTGNQAEEKDANKRGGGEGEGCE